MLLLEVQGTTQSTIFAKVKDVFPECPILIEDLPQMFPLRCLVDSCPRNANCMDKLARRVKHLFDTFPRAEMLVLYFKWRDRPTSQRAGIFWRDMREPRHVTMNWSAWEKCKNIGKAFEYHMPDSLFLPPRPAG